MNTRSFGISTFAIAALAVIAGGSPRAYALRMQVVPSSIHQNAFTAGVYLGHTVLASTNYNRLFAAGAFEARCPSTYLYPIPGSRSLTGESLIFGTQIIVTIPAVVPSL